MFYKLKRPTDIDWFDLFQLEHPDRAIDIITQMRGPHYQGQATSQLVEGLQQLCPDGIINPNVVESALRSGEFILVPYTEAMSPMLRQVITLNTSDATDTKSPPQLSEWQLTSNTFSDHLTSTLHYIIQQTAKPIFAAAAVRQKAKPGSNAGKQTTQAADKYWIELSCEYNTDSKNTNATSNNSVDNLPYIVTFSDGSTKKGRLNNGFARLTNIPAGQVTVEFGYPEAEQELKQARKDLQVCLDDIIIAVKKRGSLLDEALKKENIGMQGLIVTGAFFDGLFGTLGDTAEGIEQIAKDMADTASVKLDQWDNIADELKYETIEYIENKKEIYLEFIAEVDEKRGNVEDALNKSIKQLKSDLEELASYADKAADNAYAYGESSINGLTSTYNHYALLFEDTEIGKMLKDFPGRFYDAMPTVEAAQAGGGAGFNVLTAILTGGAGAGVAIAGLVLSKAGLFRKAKKIIDKILDLLEKKKSTPPNKISKQHNEVAKAKVDKTKKEDVKEKDKKKCKTCGENYNPRCMMAQPATSSIGDHDRNESLYSSQIKKSYKAKNLSYPNQHPWYDGDNSLQIHHVIDIKAVEDMGDIFKQFDYNINHSHNLVVLPGKMGLACRLAVPLHSGNHSLGRAFGENLESDGVNNMSTLEKSKDSKTYKKNVVKVETHKNKYKAYPEATKKELEGINKLKKKGLFCFDKKGKAISPKKSKDIFKFEMEDTSNTILKRIETFVWTINRDGRDYRPGNPCGCSGVETMGEKIKVRGTTCDMTAHGRSKMKENNFTKLRMGK